MTLRNIRMTIAYDGTEFRGWQTQPGYRTVQETLEGVIASIIGEKVFCNASGRTDAGVHAEGQVVNFYCHTALPASTLVRACNARLPQDVAVRDAGDAGQAFDANRNAIRKMYRYLIHDGPTRDPFSRRYAFRSKHRLNVEWMQAASRCLLGRHDFHSFETEWPNRMTSIRTILRLDLARQGPLIAMEIEADGFLYNMVRSIAGTLVNIGRGFWPVEEMERILRAEDRRAAGQTAPPEGLCLMQVTYE
jgi:tRNA pseudouridine38-40 synthase